MFKSFKIGSVLGIPIKLDVTFLIILPIFAWIIAFQIEDLIELLNLSMGTDIPVGPLSEGSMPWILGFAAAIGLFVSVFLHELGHSVAAIRYGFPIHSITLWLLGGVAQLSDQPTDWRQELVIAVAGPAVSVGLGIVFWIAALLMPSGLEAIIFLVAYLAVMNIVLAAFNMLPGFPMDGGRVLRALLARKKSFAEATAQAARVGRLFAIALGLFGLLAMNFILIAVALFIFIAATGEARYVAMQAAVEGIQVQDLMTPADQLDVVTPDLPLDELLELMYSQRHVGYPVVSGGGLVGIVTLDDIRGISREERSSKHVSDVMTTDIETIDRSAEAIDAIEALQRNNIGRIIVVDESTSSDEMLGLVTRTDVVRALNIGAVRGVRQQEQLPDRDPTIEEIAASGGRPRW